MTHLPHSPSHCKPAANDWPKQRIYYDSPANGPMPIARRIAQYQRYLDGRACDWPRDLSTSLAEYQGWAARAMATCLRRIADDLECADA